MNIYTPVVLSYALPTLTDPFFFLIPSLPRLSWLILYMCGSYAGNLQLLCS